MTASDVYNTREAATRYGLNPETFVKMRMAGNGPAFHKIGRRVIYSKADLDTWFDAQRRNSTSDAGEVRL